MVREVLPLDIQEIGRFFIMIKKNCAKCSFASELSSLKYVNDEEFSVPEILFKLKQNLLSRNGLSTEGLFRISGDELQIQRIKYVLDTNQAFDCKDAHCTASVIKLWFREMPHPLFKGIDLAKLNENSNVDEVLDVLAPAERNLLAWLVDLCALVAEHQEINKMPPKNLGMSLPF
jgi:hypothetical protein